MVYLSYDYSGGFLVNQIIINLYVVRLLYFVFFIFIVFIFNVEFLFCFVGWIVGYRVVYIFFYELILRVMSMFVSKLQEEIMSEIYIFFKEKNKMYFKICCEIGE